MTVTEREVSSAPVGMRSIIASDLGGAVHYCGTLCVRRNGVWYLRSAGPEENVEITACPGCGLELAKAEVVSHGKRQS